MNIQIFSLSQMPSITDEMKLICPISLSIGINTMMLIFMQYIFIFYHLLYLCLSSLQTYMPIPKLISYFYPLLFSTFILFWATHCGFWGIILVLFTGITPGTCRRLYKEQNEVDNM